MAYTYSKIATYTVGSGGISSIDFLNIPQNYTDLTLKLSLRSTRAADEDGLGLKINTATSGYTYRVLTGDGANAGSVTTYFGQMWAARIEGANAGSNIFSSTEVYIPNYTAGNYKSLSSDSVTEKNATTAYMTMAAILLTNTEPITSISLTAQNATFAQYSTAHLYGIKAEL